MAAVGRKRLTLKGLADYMTATERKRRSILRSYKYPDEDESQAKILYYREARDRIVAFHKSPHPVPWLHSQAFELEALAALSTAAAARRLNHNARALIGYAANFGSRVFTILDEVPMTLLMGGIEIGVRPDLHVIEKRAKKIIKLDFSADAPTKDAIAITTQAMFEAAQMANLAISAKHVLYFDVTRGKEHRGARMGSRMRAEIHAACQNIASIWDGI